MKLPLACLALAAAVPPAWAQVPERGAGGPSTVLVYRADLDAARRTGLAQAGERDAVLLARLRAQLQQRLKDAPGGHAIEVPLPRPARPGEAEGARLEVTVAGRPAADELAWIRERIERPGRLELAVVAREGDLTRDAGTTLEAERAKLETWLAAHPDATPVAFNAVPPAEGGPHPRLRWGLMRAEEGVEAPLLDRSLPLLVPTEPTHRFGNADLERVWQTTDQIGYPAVGFRMRPDRAAAFADFTEASVGRQLAVVLDGTVHSAPVLNARLAGTALISGRFGAEEVQALVRLLRSEALPARLELVEQLVRRTR